MRGVMLAGEAMAYAIAAYDFDTVLDVGAGEGLHAAAFRSAGKQVTTLDASDHWGKSDVTLPLERYQPAAPFDLVWASHVLEHQLNVNAFLVALRTLIVPGGFFAITVPPAKKEIVGGHVTIWNEGLLVYNLVLAGFDCSKVSIGRYGYNITAMGRCVEAELPALNFDAGDIERLARFFPWPVAENFDGMQRSVNWPPKPAGAAPRA